jgi:uncharacterized membrane protein YbhN (UPF0104 family)
VFFFAIPVAMSLLLMASGSRPAWVRGVLRQVQSAIAAVARTLKRESPLPIGWADSTAAELADAAAAVARQPTRLGWLLAIAVAMHTLSAASLGALFVAFHQSASPGAVLAGYGFAIVAWVISPVPQGVGMVEGAIVLVYSSLGIAPGPAALIAVAFRVLTLWLPLLIGFILLVRSRRLRSRSDAGNRRP